MLDWDALFETSRLRRFAATRIGWRGAILAGANVLTAVAALAGARLSLDTNLIALLPPTAPSVQALEKVLRKTGGTGELLVLVEAGSPQAAVRRADALVPRIRALPWAADVRYGPDSEFVRRNQLLYLDLTDLKEIEA